MLTEDADEICDTYVYSTLSLGTCKKSLDLALTIHKYQAKTSLESTHWQASCAEKGFKQHKKQHDFACNISIRA